jgi:hypothetical protein
MSFEVAHGSSIDPVNHLQIFPPRMEPTAEANGVEYQYPIYRGDTRYGLGLFGTETIKHRDGKPEQVFTLNLGSRSAIDAILQLKRQLQIHDGDTAFLTSLARGLVLAFATRTDNDDPVTYRAISDVSVLQACNLILPADIQPSSSGELLLAEVLIPRHTVDGAVVSGPINL